MKAFLALSLAFFCAFPSMADEKVKLKDGQTYIVPMQDDFPKLFEDEHVLVKSIAPLQGMNPKEARTECAWFIAARVKKAGEYKVSVRCPLDPSLREERPFKGPGLFGESVFSRSKFPAAWAWITEDGTSFIPFVVRFEAAQAADSFEFIQWVMFDDDAKDDVADTMPALETVTLKDGRAYAVATQDGQPFTFDSSLLTLESFGVRSSQDKAVGKVVLLWGFTGTLRAKGHFKMVVSTPLDPQITGTMDATGPGKLTPRFFSQEQCPGIWTWLNESGVSWIPFQIRFEADDPKDSFEFMQWSRMDAKAKKLLRTLMEKGSAAAK